MRVELTISAECRLVANWGWQPGSPLPAIAHGHHHAVAVRDAISMRASFVLYASASASACIGGGWFKVCRDISITIPLRYDCQLLMA